MFRIGKCGTKLEGRTKMRLLSILESGQIFDNELISPKPPLSNNCTGTPSREWGYGDGKVSIGMFALK